MRETEWNAEKCIAITYRIQARALERREEARATHVYAVVNLIFSRKSVSAKKRGRGGFLCNLIHWERCVHVERTGTGYARHSMRKLSFF